MTEYKRKKIEHCLGCQALGMQKAIIEFIPTVSIIQIQKAVSNCNQFLTNHHCKNLLGLIKKNDDNYDVILVHSK